MTMKHFKVNNYVISGNDIIVDSTTIHCQWNQIPPCGTTLRRCPYGNCSMIGSWHVKRGPMIWGDTERRVFFSGLFFPSQHDWSAQWVTFEFNPLLMTVRAQLHYHSSFRNLNWFYFSEGCLLNIWEKTFVCRRCSLGHLIGIDWHGAARVQSF